MCSVTKHYGCPSCSILRAWIEGDAECPCCEEREICLNGCTFHDDAPSQAEKMDSARQVLKDAAAAK